MKLKTNLHLVLRRQYLEHVAKARGEVDYILFSAFKVDAAASVMPVYDIYAQDGETIRYTSILN